MSLYKEGDEIVLKQGELETHGCREFEIDSLMWQLGNTVLKVKRSSLGRVYVEAKSPGQSENWCYWFSDVLPHVISLENE